MTTSNNIKKMVLATAILLSTAGTAMAVSNPITSDVKVVAQANYAPTFLVKVENVKLNNLTLLVKNAEGEVIYKEHFSSKYFSKQIQVVDMEPGTAKLTFTITDNKGYTESFEVNNEVLTTATYTVSKK